MDCCIGVLPLQGKRLAKSLQFPSGLAGLHMRLVGRQRAAQQELQECASSQRMRFLCRRESPAEDTKKPKQAQRTLEQAEQFLVCWWYLSSSCSRARSGAGVASRPSCRQYPLWPCLWNHFRQASTLLQRHTHNLVVQTLRC